MNLTSISPINRSREAVLLPTELMACNRSVSSSFMVCSWSVRPSWLCSPLVSDTLLLPCPSPPILSGLPWIDLGVSDLVLDLRRDLRPSRARVRCDPLRDVEERADVLRLLLKPGACHCDNPDLASLSPVPVPGEDCIPPSAAAAVLPSKVNAVSPLLPCIFAMGKYRLAHSM